MTADPKIEREDLVATASFDSHGLPLTYLMYDENMRFSWAQTALQTLSLKLLLESALKLDNFDRAIARSQGLEVAIEKSESGYKAMVFRASEA